MHYNWELEVEKANKMFTVAKEGAGEDRGDIGAEISATGSIDDVCIRIRMNIDPFYLRVDNPEENRANADLGEEDKRLPKSDFGDYCPVTFVNSGFMQKGNPEMEVTIFGKTYTFAGEKEMEEFKFNPTKFMIVKNGQTQLPLTPPPPKVMVLGVKGAGITTQIKNICDKYKLESLNLKEAVLKKLAEMKQERRRRRLLNRGFRPPLPADEETGEVPPDPEINDDPEDFDKEANEREALRSVFDRNKGLVIDGTWNGFPEETILALDGAAYANLLTESRICPEMIIILKCKEAAAFDRLIDRESIKKEFDRLMKERAEAAKKKREDDRAAKLAELNESIVVDEEKTQADKDAEITEAMAAWDEARDAEDEAAEEEDPEKPNKDEMEEKYRE